MYPTNQIILGGEPMFNPMEDIDIQIQRMEAYKQRLRQLQNPQPEKLIWDEIDAEVTPLSEEQKRRLLQDQEYFETDRELQLMVQTEIINLVKGRIESTEKGKDLLSRQLKVIRKLKDRIINDTNREMEMFMKFKEFSKHNPSITYEEFVKANMYDNKG